MNWLLNTFKNTYSGIMISYECARLYLCYKP